MDNVGTMDRLVQLLVMIDKYRINPRNRINVG